MPKIGIPVNLNDTEEPKPVPVGMYDLVVTQAESKDSKNGKPMVVVSIGIEGHENAPNVSHYISLPNADDEPRTANFKSLSLKRFLESFGIPYGENAGSTEFDTDDFPGAKARLELGLSEPDPETGNVYNRLKLPKLNSEGAANERRSPAPPKR